MADLIERLLARAASLVLSSDKALVREAAEALQSEETAKLKARVAELEAQLEAVKADSSAKTESYTEALRALAADAVAMNEALEPFANVAANLHPKDSDDTVVRVSIEDEVTEEQAERLGLTTARVTRIISFDSLRVSHLRKAMYLVDGREED